MKENTIVFFISFLYKHFSNEVEMLNKLIQKFSLIDYFVKSCRAFYRGLETRYS